MRLFIRVILSLVLYAPLGAEQVKDAKLIHNATSTERKDVIECLNFFNTFSHLTFITLNIS